MKIAEKQEYLDGWQRLRADFLNYKKRTDEALKSAGEAGKSAFIEDLLSAVESFDMAMANKESWEKVEKNWRVGVEYIYQQLSTALESHGLKALAPSVGDPFDPTVHSAVESIHTDDAGKDHTVAEGLPVRRCADQRSRSRRRSVAASCRSRRPAC